MTAHGSGPASVATEDEARGFDQLGGLITPDKAAATANQELKFHPLAQIFPLMEGDEFDALVADIKAHGLHEDINLYEGMILDGRNRYRACLAAYGKFPRVRSLDIDDLIDDPAAYVVSANIHRRHLTAEQKRELVEKLLKATPEKSDRQIAKIAKVSPTTVGTKRAKMEKTGDVSKLDTRQDSKDRKQPANKKPAKVIALPAKVQRELDAKDAHINELEAAHEQDRDLAEKLRAAEIKIVGLESEIEELKAENADLRAQLEAALKASATEAKPADATPKKRGRGRPKGSKNKPKVTRDTGIISEPVIGNDPGPIPACLDRTAGAS